MKELMERAPNGLRGDVLNHMKETESALHSNMSSKLKEHIRFVKVSWELPAHVINNVLAINVLGVHDANSMES